MENQGSSQQVMLMELPKIGYSIRKSDKYLSIEKASVKRRGYRNSMSDKLLKTMARLMKSKVYTEKKGKALKEVNVQDVDMQLNSDQFKAVQGKKHFYHSFLCALG